MTIWKQEGGEAVDVYIIEYFDEAAKKHAVPVGILLGTCECETNFRLGLVSSANAVGPMQLREEFAQDFYRYAGFKFNLKNWEAVGGTAGILAFYAKKSGLTDENRWRWALCAFRWGANSSQMKNYKMCKRVLDIERKMKLNNLWYNEVTNGNPVVDWALSKVGCAYSQSKRTEEKIFDCSSLVARAYSAFGFDWSLVGAKVPRSCEEVYSDQFELLWPESYDKIGKTFGKVNLANEPGDLQFLCTNRSTTRANKITHVAMVASATKIVHARGSAYGVCTNNIDLYNGKVCALTRYNPNATLRVGMRGLRVKKLQMKLNLEGAKLTVDGIYGAKTEAAVKRYGT